MVLSKDLIVLSDRKKKILFGAIDNYIKQANPITSMLVHEQNMKNLSTATLRNELSTLEELGYLKQLHTSSGRVPTSKGYRFYVNELVKDIAISQDKLDNIHNDLITRTNNLNDITLTIADAITKATNYPAVVLLDGFENLIIKSINLLPLISGQMLVIIETNAGAITSTSNLQETINQDDLSKASELFNSVFVNKTIGFLIDNVNNLSNAVKMQIKNYQFILTKIIEILHSYSSQGTSKGVTKLLNSPEYSDVEKAKSIFELLENKNKLKDIFDTTDEDGVSIKIGDENNYDELNNCAVIKTPVMLDGNKIATIGVIGPQRIDYCTVASVLKIIADELKKR